jgi:hypothetical protein
LVIWQVADHLVGSIGQGFILEIAITLQLMFLMPSCNLILSLAGSLHLQAFTIIKFHTVEAAEFR